MMLWRWRWLLHQKEVTPPCPKGILVLALTHRGTPRAWGGKGQGWRTTLTQYKKTKPKKRIWNKNHPQDRTLHHHKPSKGQRTFWWLHIAMAMHLLMQFYPSIFSPYLHYFGLLELPSQFFSWRSRTAGCGCFQSLSGLTEEPLPLCSCCLMDLYHPTKVLAYLQLANSQMLGYPTVLKSLRLSRV